MDLGTFNSFMLKRFEYRTVDSILCRYKRNSSLIKMSTKKHACNANQDICSKKL